MKKTFTQRQQDQIELIEKIKRNKIKIAELKKRIEDREKVLMQYILEDGDQDETTGTITLIVDTHNVKIIRSTLHKFDADGFKAHHKSLMEKYDAAKAEYCHDEKGDPYIKYY